MNNEEKEIEQNKYSNITLKEWLSEHILKNIFGFLFMTNTASVKRDDFDFTEREKFIKSLSLIEWFNLYGIYTTKKLLKNFYKIMKECFIVFVVINIIVFSFVIFSQLRKPEYKIQRTILMSSHVITRMYILPIEKHLGFQTPIVLPFKLVRDFLFNKGISMFPAKSPEREVWWYNTRFLEYAAVITPTILKWFDYRHTKFKEREIYQINQWNAEVYNHILLFYSTDMLKTVYKNNYLNIYRDLIFHYTQNTARFSITQQLMSSFWQKELQKEVRLKYPGPEFEAVEHNIELIKSLDALKDKMEKENNPSLKKYLQEPIIEEYLIKKDIVHRYLEYKETFEKIDCNSEEFLMYSDLQFKILNYIIQNGNSTNAKDVFRYQCGLMSSIDTSVCPLYYQNYSQKRKELSEFFVKRNQRYK